MSARKFLLGQRQVGGVPLPPAPEPRNHAILACARDTGGRGRVQGPKVRVGKCAARAAASSDAGQGGRSLRCSVADRAITIHFFIAVTNLTNGLGQYGGWGRRQSRRGGHALHLALSPVLLDDLVL